MSLYVVVIAGFTYVVNDVAPDTMFVAGVHAIDLGVAAEEPHRPTSSPATITLSAPAFTIGEGIAATTTVFVMDSQALSLMMTVLFPAAAPFNTFDDWNAPPFRL